MEGSFLNTFIRKNAELSKTEETGAAEKRS